MPPSSKPALEQQQQQQQTVPNTSPHPTPTTPRRSSRTRHSLRPNLSDAIITDDDHDHDHEVILTRNVNKLPPQQRPCPPPGLRARGRRKKKGMGVGRGSRARRRERRGFGGGKEVGKEGEGEEEDEDGDGGEDGDVEVVGFREKRKRGGGGGGGGGVGKGKVGLLEIGKQMESVSKGGEKVKVVKGEKGRRGKRGRGRKVGVDEEDGENRHVVDVDGDSSDGDGDSEEEKIEQFDAEFEEEVIDASGERDSVVEEPPKKKRRGLGNPSKRGRGGKRKGKRKVHNDDDDKYVANTKVEASISSIPPRRSTRRRGDEKRGKVLQAAEARRRASEHANDFKLENGVLNLVTPDKTAPKRKPISENVNLEHDDDDGDRAQRHGKSKATDPAGNEDKEKANSQQNGQKEPEPVRRLFEFPPRQRGAILITTEEVSRLQPQQYLNDSLVDFCIKLVEMDERHVVKGTKHRCLFFNSFFFHRVTQSLQDKSHAGVGRWTQDVDIFEKELIFVPICEAFHWSLAAIINLHRLPCCLEKGAFADHDDKGRPAIVYLDSLDLSRGTNRTRPLKNYLFNEWMHRKASKDLTEDQKKSLEDIFAKFPLMSSRVPQQRNEYDCGLYMLRNMMMLLENDNAILNVVSTKNRADFTKAYDITSILELRMDLCQKIAGFEKIQALHNAEAAAAAAVAAAAEEEQRKLNEKHVETKEDGVEKEDHGSKMKMSEGQDEKQDGDTSTAPQVRNADKVESQAVGDNQMDLDNGPENHSRPNASQWTAVETTVISKINGDLKQQLMPVDDENGVSMEHKMEITSQSAPSEHDGYNARLLNEVQVEPQLDNRMEVESSAEDDRMEVEVIPVENINSVEKVESQGDNLSIRFPRPTIPKDLPHGVSMQYARADASKAGRK